MIGRSFAGCVPLQPYAAAEASAASPANPANERTMNLRRVVATAFLLRPRGVRPARATRTTLTKRGCALSRCATPVLSSAPPVTAAGSRDPGSRTTGGKSAARDAFRRSVAAGARRAGDSDRGARRRDAARDRVEEAEALRRLLLRGRVVRRLRQGRSRR